MNQGSSQWSRNRGLERLLAKETNISDLIQMLSDHDPSPWRELIGFVPDKVEREALISSNMADLRLTSPDREALIEVKLGHTLSTEQQTAYEALSHGPELYLAALGSDEIRLSSASDRWRFLSLSELFGAWARPRGDEFVRTLASEASRILRSWDETLLGVFSPLASSQRQPLSVVSQKFLARIATRRIVLMLTTLGRLSSADVTSGGGLATVQGWTPIRGQGPDRCFIAEVRWWESKPGGELRFGVDFDPRPKHDEDEEVRRAAYNLARSMDATINFASLQKHLEQQQPELARFLHRKKPSRPQAKGDWEEVIVHGFAGARLADGSKNSRRRTSPDFYGDGALRHEAIANISFERASGADLVDLIDATLDYLVQHQP